MPETNRILIIVTNFGEYEKVGYRTGLWLCELTHFWDAAEEAGYRMAIASPSGGYVPIDPESLMLRDAGHALDLDGNVHERYEDRAFMDRLVGTMKVADADAAAYDATYMTGGHGVCFDFRNEDLAKLTAAFWEAGKIVSAVCHGPAGLLEVKLSGGGYLIDGKDLRPQERGRRSRVALTRPARHDGSVANSRGERRDAARFEGYPCSVTI
jgi:putative intracellular protease/amidase